jgi:hypothetical protein
MLVRSPHYFAIAKNERHLNGMGVGTPIIFPELLDRSKSSLSGWFEKNFSAFHTLCRCDNYSLQGRSIASQRCGKNR